MAGYINDNTLRKELRKEFKDKQGEMEKGDLCKLFNIIAKINQKTRIFKKLPESLATLAHNALYIQIYNKIKRMEYNEDGIISRVKDILKYTDLVIDIIKEAAKELDSDSKKQAFYKLIMDNHMFMLVVYNIRRDFYNSSIFKVCNSIHNMPELYNLISSEDAMVKLCQLTESEKYSRLQRALDILMKHGDNLIITDANGVEHSNHTELGLSNDDIYSLSLLTSVQDWSDPNYFTRFMIGSIYRSINVKIEGDEDYMYNPIYSLYSTLFCIFVEKNIPNLELYKKENIDILKEYLKQILTIERLSVTNEIMDTEIYRDIKDHEDFNIDNFKNGLINNYMESVKYNISIIDGTHIPEENKAKSRKGLTIITVIPIIIMIILSIFMLYPNESVDSMLVHNDHTHQIGGIVPFEAIEDNTHRISNIVPFEAIEDNTHQIDDIVPEAIE
ncbi:hypothetical protein NEIRO03_2488 [Nematocida sp. AWRm78]|nr:hypothetical protein NEIRO02_2477 [Nematocida sp. AWRm79]KAI5187249.1 hypothetical protein NEIRO03_2488 [Nematocida sp. AWRm78]